MKWNKVFFVVATLACLSVLEVKSEAKISDLRPNEAEQNFVNIKKTMEIRYFELIVPKLKTSAIHIHSFVGNVAKFINYSF